MLVTPKGLWIALIIFAKLEDPLPFENLSPSDRILLRDLSLLMQNGRLPLTCLERVATRCRSLNELLAAIRNLNLNRSINEGEGQNGNKGEPVYLHHHGRWH